MAAKKTVTRRPPRRGKMTARQLQSLRRAREAISYLRQGYTYEVAAEFVGFRSRQSCWYAVQRLIEAERQQAVDEARELLEIQKRRLDELLQAVMPKAVSTGDPMLVDATLKVLDRFDRLYGFSKPLKIAPTTPDGDEPLPPTPVLDLGKALARLKEHEARKHG